MSDALFDKIHNDAYRCKRTEPATIEEFVEFGLSPEDYVKYIALQQKLQSALLLNNFTRSGTKDCPEFEDLLAFCQAKKLVASPNSFQPSSYTGLQAAELQSTILRRSDAEYYHGWLQYPIEPAAFRLSIERKLSLDWDVEDAYILETFGVIAFDYEGYSETPDGRRWIEPDSPVRIKRYDEESKALVTLSVSEVKKLFEIAQKEKNKIDNEVEQHLNQLSPEHNASAASSGLPWIKKWYVLTDKQDIVDEVYERIKDAANSPEIYDFKENDTLFVFSSIDMCKEYGHFQTNISANFKFYSKPDKRFIIKYCSLCGQYRISLKALMEIFDSYGVPCCKIKYDDDTCFDSSIFSDTSVFHNIGYTVSQSAGLSAPKRQSILEYAIKSGKASKWQVLSFLKQRIDINGAKPGNEIALQKWKADYEYVKSL